MKQRIHALRDESSFDLYKIRKVEKKIALYALATNGRDEFQLRCGCHHSQPSPFAAGLVAPVPSRQITFILTICDFFWSVI